MVHENRFFIRTGALAINTDSSKNGAQTRGRGPNSSMDACPLSSSRRRQNTRSLGTVVATPAL